MRFSLLPLLFSAYHAKETCVVKFEEVSVVKQVPTYKKHCHVIEDTKCKTVYKNAFETTMETQCEPTFETKCDPVMETAYEQKCRTITDKECRIVHVEHMGKHQEKTICTDVPQEKCVPVPVKIQAEKCVNIPVQSCSNVPVTSPVEVPKQECWKKPRKVCQTLVTLKPKVVTEKIPKEVCDNGLSHSPFPHEKKKSPFLDAFNKQNVRPSSSPFISSSSPKPPSAPASTTPVKTNGFSFDEAKEEFQGRARNPKANPLTTVTSQLQANTPALTQPLTSLQGQMSSFLQQQQYSPLDLNRFSPQDVNRFLNVNNYESSEESFGEFEGETDMFKREDPTGPRISDYRYSQMQSEERSAYGPKNSNNKNNNPNKNNLKNKNNNIINRNVEGTRPRARPGPPPPRQPQSLDLGFDNMGYNDYYENDYESGSFDDYNQGFQRRSSGPIREAKEGVVSTIGQFLKPSLIEISSNVKSFTQELETMKNQVQNFIQTNRV